MACTGWCFRRREKSADFDKIDGSESESQHGNSLYVPSFCGCADAERNERKSAGMYEKLLGTDGGRWSRLLLGTV